MSLLSLNNSENTDLSDCTHIMSEYIVTWCLDQSETESHKITRAQFNSNKIISTVLNSAIKSAIKLCVFSKSIPLKYIKSNIPKRTGIQFKKKKWYITLLLINSTLAVKL